MPTINTTSNWLCSGAFLSMLMPPGRVAVSIPLVGQDSNLVVRRIPHNTLEILFHALTQCQRWHRLAAITFVAATPVHLAQANHRGHSPPAIRHTRLRVRRPGIGSALDASHATQCYVFRLF